jgi:GDP-4-dehydro-6-deoxy-D-mannose reductase
MKALITGITGSGGSYLAEYIINNKKGVEVCGTSRLHTAKSHDNLKRVRDKVNVIICDLCDFPNLYRILDREKPDVIFHLASLANVRDAFDNTVSTYLNNVKITLNLLEAVRTISNYNPIIQICSTSEVYGSVSPEEIPITEKNKIKPINPYASSKLAQDNLGYVYHKSFGLNVITTRMFTYLNARRKDLFASSFAKQIVEIENGEKDILKHGNLASVRTLIDVRDAMESYWVAVEKCEIGEVYNIGGETSISVGDFLNLLIKNSNTEIKTEQCPKLTRPVDVTLQIPDCTKFKKATGWQPKYSFEESVEYFLQEIRNNE